MTDESTIALSKDTKTTGAPTRWFNGKYLVVGTVLGGVLLWIATRDIAWASFREILLRADPFMLVSGAAFYGLYLVAKAGRWSLLLAERCHVRPFLLLFRATTWGTAANAIFPHSGELLRTFETRKPLGLTASSILGSIAAERVYDVLTVLCIAAIASLLIDDAPLILRLAIGSIAVIGTIAIAILVLIAFGNRFVVSLLEFVLRFFPTRFAGTALKHANELAAGIRGAFVNANLGWIAISSVAQWLCVIACVAFCIAAFDLEVPLWAAFVIVPLTVAGLTLPTAPGYLGTVQVCFIAALSPLGISNEGAIAASFAYTAVTTVLLVLVAGFWYIIRLIADR